MQIPAKNITCIICLLFIRSFGLAAQDSVIIDAGRALPQAKFYFKGEGHQYVRENAKALMALLKYTYVNHHVRYLVLECGPDQAYLANYYLQEGNDSLPVKASLYMGIGFWKMMYDFNRTLPPNERVKICGYDFNRFVHTARALRLMFGQKAVKDAQLKKSLEKVMDWDNEPWDFGLQKEFGKKLARLRKVSEANAAELESVLGDDYVTYLAILQNKTPSSSSVKRDEEMILQLIAALPSMENGSLLFNYGIAHTVPDGVGAARLLRERREFSDSVCSIYPFYKKERKWRFLEHVEKKLSQADKEKADQSEGHLLMPVDVSSGFHKGDWLLVHP